MDLVTQLFDETFDNGQIRRFIVDNEYTRHDTTILAILWGGSLAQKDQTRGRGSYFGDSPCAKPLVLLIGYPLPSLRPRRSSNSVSLREAQSVPCFSLAPGFA